MARLELENVRKQYGETVAVAGVSLGVEPGYLYGLLGPNGAGKTTTIRMIMNIIAPDSGQVLYDGRPRTPADLRRIGYLPEERGLYGRMTVTDHLLFLAQLHGVPSRVATEAIARWLDRVGLAARARSKVEELSKGMQQKIQLIGTLLHEPELIILDEPFSGLDPINQGLFKDLLAEYKSQGRTIVLSTHGMEQAEKLCDQICLISKGSAVLTGSISEIKRSFGGNSYRLIGGGELERLRELPGVVQVLIQNDEAKLLLGPDVVPADVLAQAIRFVTVREFRSEEPTLEEIFIKAVRDAA